MEHLNPDKLPTGLRRIAFLPSHDEHVLTGRALDVWQAHQNTQKPQQQTGAAPRQEHQPHHSDVLAELRSLLDAFGAAQTALVYVHRGHQPFYRTPLLQGLLAQLPDMGAHLSHRSESDTLPDEALTMVRALLHRIPHVILLWDRQDRLQPEAPSAARSCGPAIRILSMHLDDRGALAARGTVEFHQHPLRPEPNS